MEYIVVHFRQHDVKLRKYADEQDAWNKFQDFHHASSNMESSTFMYEYDRKTAHYELLHARETAKYSRNGLKSRTLKESPRHQSI